MFANHSKRELGFAWWRASEAGSECEAVTFGGQLLLF